MHRLLLIDDEALSLIGLRTMFEELADLVEVVGSARNGNEGLELIERLRPDIVITDVRMPGMDGLEMIRRCQAQTETTPLFVVLTSYEDFQLVRETMQLGVRDYLIKSEITVASLRKLVGELSERLERQPLSDGGAALPHEIFLNRFFNRLLNHVFISKDEIQGHIRQFDLQLGSAGERYQTLAIDIGAQASATPEDAAQLSLYRSVMRTISLVLETLVQHHIVVYSHSTIAVILSYHGDGPGHEQLQDWTRRMRTLAQRYCSVDLSIGVGLAVDSLLALPESFHAALLQLRRSAHKDRNDESPPETQVGLDMPNMTALNRAIILALDEGDEALFRTLIQRLESILEAYSLRVEDAIDLVATMLHLIDFNLSQRSETHASQQRAISSRMRLALYASSEIAQVIALLPQIADEVIQLMQIEHRSSHPFVQAAMEYISLHIEEKLSLAQVADAISVSPNYLSSVFSQYSDQTFSAYVTSQKVRRAQELLATTSLRIYEISERLGFESDYYFSTVFRRETGSSPRQYRQIHQRPPARSAD